MKTSKVLVIGFALFAMFFGAGNMIFPPYLGLTSGAHWTLGFWCFLAADVGLAMITIAAMLRRSSRMTELTRPLGRPMSVAVSAAVVLCLGPLFAMPRTAATTYELLVKPFFASGVWKIVFSAVYFALVVALTISPSKVVDVVGKVLTPLLLLGLLVLIGFGMFRPLGSVSVSSQLPDVAHEGLLSGYQTMDAFGAMVFASVVAAALDEQGFVGRKARTRAAVLACGLSAVCLCAVYGGLTYLGATVSMQYSAEIDRTLLLIDITQRLMGRPGVLILGVVVALACLTTAIGLASATGLYFAELTKNRLSYKAVVIGSCAVSLFAANLGLDRIISFAAPVLTLLYPVVLVLVIFSFFDRRLTNANIARGAALCAFGVSLCNLLSPSLLETLPLSSFGLGWMLPALLGGAAGALIRPRGEQALSHRAAAD